MNTKLLIINAENGKKIGQKKVVNQQKKVAYACTCKEQNKLKTRSFHMTDLR